MHLGSSFKSQVIQIGKQKCVLTLLVFKMLKVSHSFHSIDTQYVLLYPLTTVKVYRPLFCYFIYR